MKLGLRGVSVFFSSGDSGVASRSGCLGKNSTIFNPGWPASCPYITSVGATKIPANRSVSDPEVAANDPAGHPYATAYATGGGFSNIFGIPDYQADAVAKYALVLLILLLQRLTFVIATSKTTTPLTLTTTVVSSVRTVVSTTALVVVTPTCPPTVTTSPLSSRERTP